MASCCGAPRCNCSVTAGPGVTVDGNGSPTTPYVISADAGTPTPVQAADTTTVDTTVAGTGTAADPYVISSDVILDPAPPGGGSNLAHAGPNGVYVECADVRGCLTGGDGIAYDPATGEIDARPSTDAGNVVTFGTDGGLFAPAAAATIVEPQDSTTVDVTVSGTGTAADPYEVSAAVILDPAPPGGGTNLLGAGPGGLSLECDDVRGCFSATGPATYDPATGTFGVELSADPGNTTVIGSDGGLFTPPPGAAAPTVVQAQDSPTVDVTVSGTGTAADPYEVGAAVILDPAPPGGGTNLLGAGPGGLSLECDDVRGCFSAGDGAGYDPATGVITARLSADAGNSVAFGTDGGLFAPPASGGAATALEVTDSSTVDLTLSGTGTAADPYDVTAAVKLDPAPPGGGTNLLGSGPGGLSLECDDVRGCFSATGPATYDPATGTFGVELSADPGNTTVIGSDGGLFTPTPGAAAPTVVQAGDTTTVDTTVTGTGTAADPYIVKADAIVAPEPNGLEAGPTGLLVAPSSEAGNRLTMGTDNRLFVPPVAVDCGLTGAGTTADPFTVNPAAGQAAWTDDWGCDAATHSTLKCDPGTGQLWTPPDHYSAMDHIYVEHFAGGFLTPIGPTGGWVIIDPGANQQFNVPPNFLGNDCRTWGYEITNAGTWDIEHNAAAAFQLGVAVQVDGGALQIRPLWGHINAVGAAHRERGNGSVNWSGWGIPAGTGASVIMFPAVSVTAGQITAIHSWVSDATIDTQTNTP
ncbi:hypothetical protein VSR01_17095 [Actinacidiphila sp. DG2A-62]|uniref:hypothetical protein n=1 Tax=Actinacidiphila sp. DG2A-62 TaxID=3108821 RepID=UPI002DB6F13B|nr:hypothetical protein [Actinacidiphila sp. DG2A-62]MEC3995155.1 hypothetical protein [Actinacidiphila sp. DG2A-62]